MILITNKLRPSSSLVEVVVEVEVAVWLRLGMGLGAQIKSYIQNVRSTNEFKSYFFGRVGGWRFGE